MGHLLELSLRMNAFLVSRVLDNLGRTDGKLSNVCYFLSGCTNWGSMNVSTL